MRDFSLTRMLCIVRIDDLQTVDAVEHVSVHYHCFLAADVAPTRSVLEGRYSAPNDHTSGKASPVGSTVAPWAS